MAYLLASNGPLIISSRNLNAYHFVFYLSIKSELVWAAKTNDIYRE